MNAKRISPAALLALLLSTPLAKALDAGGPATGKGEPTPNGLPPDGASRSVLPFLQSRGPARFGWATEVPDKADLKNNDLPPPYRDFEINYLPRDAQVLIGQPKGGYGVVTMGKASDYTGGDGKYHVSSGYGCFQLSDVITKPAQPLAAFAYAECAYLETASSVAGATAMSIEVISSNYGGSPPTINPFQVNNPGAVGLIQLNPGASSQKKDSWPNSCLICIPNFNGQAMRGIVIGSKSLAGSNGAQNVFTKISTLANSRIIVLPRSPKELGLVVGHIVSSKHIQSGSVVTGVFPNGNRIEISKPAAMTAYDEEATFINASGIVIEMAPHHEIRWTNDTNGARGAFIRSDSAAGERSLGIRFHAGGMSWVNAANEEVVAGLASSGDTYGSRFLSVGPPPSIKNCGDTPPPPHPSSTAGSGQFTTGIGARSCEVFFSSEYPGATFCTLTPANLIAAKSKYFIEVSTSSHFDVTFVESIDRAKFNYVCGGKYTPE